MNGFFAGAISTLIVSFVLLINNYERDLVGEDVAKAIETCSIYGGIKTLSGVKDSNKTVTITCNNNLIISFKSSSKLDN